MAWEDILKQNALDIVIETLKRKGPFYREQGEDLQKFYGRNLSKFDRQVTKRFDELLALWEKENEGNYEELAQMIGDYGMPPTYAGKSSINIGLGMALEELKGNLHWKRD